MDYDNSLKMTLIFSEEKEPFLLDVTSLLYDFELMHDLVLLVYSKEYSEYVFTNRFYYRTGRPLEKQHRLRAVKIVKKSPLIIEVSMAVGALWAFIQAIEKISNWKINKEKLRLEVEKLKLDIYKEKRELEKELLEREVQLYYDNMKKRLEDNPIKLIDISIEKPEDERDYTN